MNHYPHHIGDFNNATRHLTRIERSIYSDMIDLYYDTEHPLPADHKKLARRLLVVSPEELEAMQSVLDEFFTLGDDGYHNDRCDREIAAYREKSEKASNSAKARWSKDRTEPAKQSEIKDDANALRAQSESNANQNQNQYTNTDVFVSSQDAPKNPKETGRDKTITQKQLSENHGIDQQIAKDFLAIRKARRSPLTSTALSGIEREAAKAGVSLETAMRICVEHGWQGFKAEWHARLSGSNEKVRELRPMSAVDRVRAASMSNSTGDVFDGLAIAVN